MRSDIQHGNYILMCRCTRGIVSNINMAYGSNSYCQDNHNLLQGVLVDFPWQNKEHLRSLWMHLHCFVVHVVWHPHSPRMSSDRGLQNFKGTTKPLLVPQPWLKQSSSDLGGLEISVHASGTRYAPRRICPRTQLLVAVRVMGAGSRFSHSKCIWSCSISFFMDFCPLNTYDPFENC